MTYAPGKPMLGSVAQEMNASGYPYHFYLPGEFTEDMVFRWLHSGRRIVGISDFGLFQHSYNVINMSLYRDDFIELYVTEGDCE
jgi:hypothetical protein